MASSPRTREREEERRLNLRTLAIASVASASAAAVTSQLWIRGTWIAAAITPVIVTLVSELLRHPTDRIAQALTDDTAAVPDPGAPAPRVGRPPEARPVRRPAVEQAPGSPPAGPAIPPDPDAPRAGTAGPVRVYRQPTRRPPRRRIAYGMVAATAAIAFVVGIVVLTGTELIAGESIGKSGSRSTLFGGSGKKKTSEPEEQQRTTPTETEEQDREQETSTEEQPPPTTETAPQPTTTEPAPTQQPPPGEPPTSTAPSQTTPAP